MGVLHVDAMAAADLSTWRVEKSKFDQPRTANLNSRLHNHSFQQFRLQAGPRLVQNKPTIIFVEVS